MGVDRKTNTAGGGALQRGHRDSLESLAQLGDALCSVGAQSKTVEAAELVAGQAAKLERSRVSTGIDKMANTQEPVRAMGGVLQVHQRRIVFDALRESGSSFRTKGNAPETASTVRTAAVGC